MKPSHPVRGAEESAEAPSAFSSASRTPKSHTVLAVLFVAGCLGGFAASLIALPHAVQAARNSSGVYSLPSGNPVVSGTTITSSWANNTLTDLGTEITNSLDRSGRGGMTGALECANGSVSAPGLSFVSEPSSGLYRAGSNDVRLSIGGADKLRVTATATTNSNFLLCADGSAAAPGISFSGEASSGLYRNATNDVRMSVNQADQEKWTATGVTVVNGLTATNTQTNGNGLTTTGNGTGAGISATGGSGGGNGGTFLASGAGNGIRGDASGTGAGVLAGGGGLKIGSSGTTITASYGATYNLATGNVGVSSCTTLASQTLTGVSVGGVCSVSTDSVHGSFLTPPGCVVSSSNTVQIYLCNLDSSLTHSYTDNFRVRVFQP